MKGIITCYFLVLSILMQGCIGIDKESVTFNRIYSDVNDASKGLLRFTDFKKINGKEIIQGTLKYELEYQGFIAATKGCCWEGSIIKVASFSSLNSGSTKTMFPLKFEKIKECNDTLNTSYTKEGWGYKIVGKAYFEKRDNGWELLDYIFVDSVNVDRLSETIARY